MGKKGDALRAAKAAKREKSIVAQYGPVRLNGIEKDQIVKLSGLSMAQLDAWTNEQRQKITNETHKGYQALLTQAEDAIGVLYIVSILSCLEDYHWGRSASKHICEKLPEVSEHIKMEDLRPVYERLHEKWGIELEFSDVACNRLIYPPEDAPDWREEYFKDMKVPEEVVNHFVSKVWDEAIRVATYETQLAMMWELCEDFNFHKKPGMMERFENGIKEKFHAIDNDIEKPREVEKMLRKKYKCPIDWTEGTNKILDKFFGKEEKDEDDEADDVVGAE